MPETTDAIVPQLIVGLGNPGEKYHRTRHNIGFEIIDELARRWQISLSSHRKFQGAYGDGVSGAGRKIALLQPHTFMNRSGQSIRAVLDWYKFPASSVLVIYDDMDLPTGRLRLRLSGSAGGHNGMKSVIAHLGTQEFPRLRIGIGNSNKVGDRDQAVISHVLGKFSPEERKQMDEIVLIAADAVETSLKAGVEQAMNHFNSRGATLP